MIKISNGQTRSKIDTLEIQESTSKKTKWPNLALSPGIAYQGQTFGEINILIGHYESSRCSGNAFPGIRLGIESNLKSGNDQIYAPKIGAEVSGMLICFRATVLTYIKESYAQLRFLPEAGVSFLGFANLTYGYNFPLSKTAIEGIQNHRICLSININRLLIDDVFGVEIRRRKNSKKIKT